MIWIFVLGLIVLCVYNAPFRKFVLWTGGIAAAVVALWALVVFA